MCCFTLLQHIFWPNAGLYLTDVGLAQQEHAEPGLTNSSTNCIW